MLRGSAPGTTLARSVWGVMKSTAIVVFGPPGPFALFAKGVGVNDGEGTRRVAESDASGKSRSLRRSLAELLVVPMAVKVRCVRISGPVRCSVCSCDVRATCVQWPGELAVRAVDGALY